MRTRPVKEVWLKKMGFSRMFFVACLLAFQGLIPGPVVSGEGTAESAKKTGELIKNGGFDKVVQSGTNASCPPWSFWQGEGKTNQANAEFITNAYYGGKCACKLQKGVWAAQEITAKPGDFLRITLCAKAEGNAEWREGFGWGTITLTLFQYREGKCVNTCPIAQAGVEIVNWGRPSVCWGTVPAGEFDRLELAFIPSDWAGPVWLAAVSATIAGSNYLSAGVKGRVNVKVGDRVMLCKVAATNWTEPYNWYPIIHRMANGNIVATCQTFTNAGLKDPNVEVARRMLSTDGGKTWKDIGGVTRGGPEGITLRDGTYLELCGVAREGHPAVTVIRSKDNGLTYTTQTNVPITFDNANKVEEMAFKQGLVEMDNGDLLATMNVRFQGDSKGRCILVQSADKGQSWRYVSTIAHDDPSFCDFSDPALIRTGPINLLVLMCGGTGNPMYQAGSGNSGKTWSKPVPVDKFGVGQDLVMTDDGILVCSYGQHGIYAMCSADGQGREWNDPTPLWESYPTTMHTRMVKTGPHNILLIHDVIGYKTPHNILGYNVGDDEKSAEDKIMYPVNPGDRPPHEQPADTNSYHCVFVVPLTIERAQAKQERTMAEVKGYHGAPTLFLNGKPNSAMTYMTYCPWPRYFEQFSHAGIHIHQFAATPTETPYGHSTTSWTGPGEFDYEPFEVRVKMILKADPEAYLIPRLYLGVPSWWSRRHPDDLFRCDTGDGHTQPFCSLGPPPPSWASRTWREDTAQALRHMIAHIQASTYADRVIGYTLCSGTTEEWRMWGINENQWGDYSPASLAGFRAYLKAKYGTDAALQAAWHDPAATLDTASMPMRKERAAPVAFGVFRDPVREQRVIDFYLYQSDMVADTICYFARVVKEATNREKIVGSYYGYILELPGQDSGHLALRKVWNCPDLDFLTSPESYWNFRQPGTGYSHFMSLTDSVRLHGKLWFNENDIRTWSTWKGIPVGEQFGKAATYEETLGQERRELANVLANACGHWWFDMEGAWYQDPRIMGEISKMKTIADGTLALDRSPVDEIAVVLDDTSLCYTQGGEFPIGGQLLPLARIGAPVGYYALDDLNLIPPRRMYVFLNCYAPTAEHRRLIEKLKANGHVLVWVYAQGLYRDGQLNEGAMQTLTGIHLCMKRPGQPLQVKISGSHSALDGMTYGIPDSSSTGVDPVIYADDPAVTVWGRLVGGNQAGLVVREFPGWTSVFSSAPNLPAELLRHLARKAKVHLYLDPAGSSEDVVYANRSLLALCANAAGPRKIHLPSPSTVYDLFAGKEVGRGLTEFTVEAAAHEIKLWRITHEK